MTPRPDARSRAGRPATAGGWWAKLAGVWAEVVAWAALVVFTIVGIGAPLVGEGTLLHTDGFTTVAPWTSALEETQDLLLVGDTIDSVTPQTMLLTEQIAAGDFAEWNPYVAGGAELGGLPNSGAYSPLSAPWWVLPADLAPAMVKLLEIVVIAIGMSLFLRRLGIARVAWPLASLAFASSGFMIAWTNWPQTRVAAFIPLLFWALDRAAVRTRLIDLVPIGLTLGAMFLGGFPAIVGYALYAGGAYVLIRSIVARRSVRGVLQSTATSLGGVVLGAAIAAWQLVPFAVNALTVVDFEVREQTADSHLPWSALASAFVPDVNGGPEPLGVWVSGHPVEDFSYLGAVVVALAVAAILIPVRARSRHPATVTFAVGFLVCVLVAYIGEAFLAPLLDLPVFSSSRIGRLRSIIGFFAAVLAAFGVHALLDPAPLRAVLRAARTRVRVVLRLVIGLIVTAVVAVTAVMLATAAVDEVPGDFRFPLVDEQARLVAIGAAAAILLIVVAWVVRVRVLRQAIAATMSVLVLVPALGVTALWWRSSPESTFYAETPVHEYLEAHLGDDRYATVGNTLLPGSNTAYRLRSVGGHAFHTTQWRDLILAVDPDAFGSPTYSSLTADGAARSAASPILDRLGTRYLVTAPAHAIGAADPFPPAPATIPIEDGVPITTGPHTGPVRGITFDARTAARGDDGVTVHLELVDETGEVLTETETWVPAFDAFRTVPVAGDAFADDAVWSVRLTLTGIDAPVEAGATTEGEFAVGVVRPADDGLTTVHTGDATVYERGNALDRVRWASRELVIADPGERVDALADGRVPSDAVLLSSEADRRSPEAGSTAEIDVRQPEEDTFVYDVSADGAGWLLIEDSFNRPGWSATVDGVDAPVVEADHAAGAVYVEAGEHTVEVAYRTPGLVAGLWVTLGAGVLTALICVASWIGAVRRRARRGKLSADDAPRARA